VELLVSIALVMLIVLGVNMVFKHASDAVGTGTAISEVTRGFRAAYTTLRDDIEGDSSSTGMLPLNTTHPDRPPFLIISSEIKDPHPISDRDGNPGLLRLDGLIFFSQGTFKRQNGNDNEFIASMPAASKAMISYGHLWLPTNGDPEQSASWYYDVVQSASNVTFPGYGTAANNPNNYYARDWRLGRSVIGIRPRDANNRILDNFGVAQRYLTKGASAYYSDTASLAPLSEGSGTTTGGASWSTDAPYIQDSRCDLAGLDINWYRDSMVAVHAAASPTWAFDHFVRGMRFKANPFAARPLTTRAAAQAAPILLSGCVNFRVDFAGDMDQAGGIDLTQDSSGIQWYGRPYDYDGNGTVTNDPRDVRAVHERYGQAANTVAYERINGSIYTWGWSQYELGLPGLNGGRPSLIRLTLTVVDSNGRLAEGMTQEFIFRVPQ
jgi:hypothetical protein